MALDIEYIHCLLGNRFDINVSACAAYHQNIKQTHRLASVQHHLHQGRLERDYRYKHLL